MQLFSVFILCISVKGLLL